MVLKIEALVFKAIFSPEKLFYELVEYKREDLYELLVSHYKDYGMEVDFLQTDSRKILAQKTIEKIRNSTVMRESEDGLTLIELVKLTEKKLEKELGLKD